MNYIAFAQWFGLITLAISLGVLFNLDDAKEMAKNMCKDESGYIMAGVLPIIFGSMTFNFEHAFEFSWQLAVSLVGLLMFLGGVFRVMLPKLWKTVMHRHMDKVPSLFSLFGLMLAVLLLYVGYLAPVVSYN
ncbi:MAG: hypothetical protein AB7F64_03315 [Gammaproteobacteria bacterium]